MRRYYGRSFASEVYDGGRQGDTEAVSEFCSEVSWKKLVVLELGTGWRNQLIKAPLMNLVKKEPYAAYITINKGEIYIPDEIAAKSYGLDGDMTEILERLKEASEERNQ